MAGNKAGGLKAAAKNLANDPDHYKKIGKIGGANGHTGGFAYLKEVDPEKFREASAKGGFISRRRNKVSA
ncbi:hypothetical protein E3T26_06885 [Cryobacterium sp. TMT1-21]|uniref:general stress protein n=1 Tax=Cryobacterium sp. TMT1-21 TaxID=1259234 RepID=UPI00106C9D59|nr:hypothetical protein [Cryobacterium sp. TMT1-21]TFD15501.1 hypothetical protein E3T26_06885 [Cryobacterium sp. TMT1-21]